MPAIALLWRDDEIVPEDQAAVRLWINGQEIPFLIGVGRTADANTVNLTLTLTLPVAEFLEQWVEGDIAGLPQPEAQP